MIILKPYIEYKDSGIKWIGNIPSHWETNKLKFLLSEPLKYGANEPAEYDELSWPRYIRITDIDEKGLLKKKTFKSISEDIAYPYLLKDGDILFARSGATVGKTFFYLKSFGKSAYAGYLIRARFKNKKVFSKFIYYFSRSNIYWEWIKSNFIQATIQNISAEKYSNLLLPLPLSLKEQQAIASYLDDRTKQIDSLIEKKQQQIKLLQEKRSALITHKVTKGLDPKVKMKDSYVKWLGKIPAHWTAKKLKYLAIVNSSNVDKKTKEHEKDILLCNYVDVYKNDYIDNGINFMKATASDTQIKKFRLQKNDVIITKDSESPNDIGVPAFVLKDFEDIVCGYHLAQIKPKTIIGSFLFRCFQTKWLQAYFEISAKGITRYGLSVSDINSSIIPIPTIIDEQKIIANFLDKETSKIDTLILKIKQSIQLLKEYRPALITAAVTGKINVQKNTEVIKTSSKKNRKIKENYNDDTV